MTPERVGVMVIRLWTEGPGTELRARLTRTLDVVEAGGESEAVRGVEGVLAAVREFLDAFGEGQRSQPLS